LPASRRDLIGDLFKRNDRDGAGNGIVFFFCKVNDALIGAAAEMEVGVTEFSHERTVNESINIWKDLAHAGICQDLLISETGITPDILSCFLLDAACQFSEGLNLIERITPGKCHIRELVRLDNLKEFLYRDLLSTLKVP
jgi:hypothetical protein